jgi:hypothetical protein
VGLAVVAAARRRNCSRGEDVSAFVRFLFRSIVVAAIISLKKTVTYSMTRAKGQLRQLVSESSEMFGKNEMDM